MFFFAVTFIFHSPSANYLLLYRQLFHVSSSNFSFLLTPSSYPFFFFHSSLPLVIYSLTPLPLIPRPHFSLPAFSFTICHIGPHHTGTMSILPPSDPPSFSYSSLVPRRVWEVTTGEVLNTLIHHNEAVLHLRFANGLMVTCSKDRSIAVWDMASPTDISLRRVLVGHRAAVNVVDFDDKYIVSASGDRTIKVRRAAQRVSRLTLLLVVDCRGELHDPFCYSLSFLRLKLRCQTCQEVSKCLFGELYSSD